MNRVDIQSNSSVCLQIVDRQFLELNDSKKWKLINEMSALPKIVAETDVGKKVKVKIWRNKREITKEIILGRLETSDDFKTQGTVTQKPKESVIEGLKITVRLLDKKDVSERSLPKGTTGLVITKIEKDSPVNYLKVKDIIVEAQKKKIRSIRDLENVVDSALKSSEKTILVVIYNNENQRRYIGIKLD